ncbi:mucin-17-like protein [Dinothrombium tinctorium]|uniref:Mucin-17-like protein n=1 Tax=Dinothrombium tinctorium TaxID=1965070 RepID=A0A443RJ63_9ACAR|nr:mucin-17-like protein [Dinothrombium tinctorium]
MNAADNVDAAPMNRALFLPMMSTNRCYDDAMILASGKAIRTLSPVSGDHSQLQTSKSSSFVVFDSFPNENIIMMNVDMKKENLCPEVEEPGPKCKFLKIYNRRHRDSAILVNDFRMLRTLCENNEKSHWTESRRKKRLEHITVNSTLMCPRNNNLSIVTFQKSRGNISVMSDSDPNKFSAVYSIPFRSIITGMPLTLVKGIRRTVNNLVTMPIFRWLKLVSALVLTGQSFAGLPQLLKHCNNCENMRRLLFTRSVLVDGSFIPSIVTYYEGIHKRKAHSGPQMGPQQCSNSLICANSKLIVTLILVILLRLAVSAPHSFAKVKSPREKGCYYLLKHYQNGEQIETNEPCLNCSCVNSMLMCYLRVCPFIRPLGERCIIEKVPGECCPKIICPDVKIKDRNAFIPKAAF